MKGIVSMQEPCQLIHFKLWIVFLDFFFFSNIQCVFQWIICKCHLSSVYATVKLLLLGVLPYHCEATSYLFESFFSPHRCSAIFLHDLGYFCFWLFFSLHHFIYSSFIFNFAFGCCARYTISNVAAKVILET